MTFSGYWYCIRQELERENGKPHYGRLLRDALKVFHPLRFNNPSKQLPKSEFLFVIITENHVKHFQPVAAQLSAQKHSFSIIYTNHSHFQQFRAVYPEVSYSAESFVRRWQYFQSLLFQAVLLIRHLFSSSAKKSCIIRFAKPAYLLEKTMLRVLAGACDKVVLFKAESYQANAVLLASKALKIPSFAIQHGLIGDTSQVSDLLVDRYLVWSALFQQRLARWRAGCAVDITGNAAYDVVFQAVAQSNGASLAANPVKLLVLPSPGFSHTPLSEVYLLLDMAIRFARQHPEAQISIKPHPADFGEYTSAYILRYLSGCPNITLLDRKAPIPFAGHHLVALNNSGAGMEACIWSRPMVVVASKWESVMVKQYVDEGVAAFADSYQNFELAVSKIQANYAAYQDKCRVFTENQLAHQGHAAEKIVEVLTC
jgi:hypothetical protein